jgi:hypothetical protein
MIETAVDIPYRLAWRTRTARVGAHRSTFAGTGGMFRDLTSLLDARDPRRIDLRQSLRDPFENTYVRRLEQTSAISVSVLMDVSTSMTFSGRSRKFALACDLAQTIASSAIRTGDTFALIAADTDVRTDLTLAPSRSRSAIAQKIDEMRRFVPSCAGAGGLIEAATLTTGRRGLVFLVSDFLMPDDRIHAIFERLSRHDVIPVALHDSAEIEALPEWGIVELVDLETGRRRLIVLRPSFKETWRRRIEARRSDFRSIARHYGREPFEVTDRIDWERLAAHLMSGAR